MITKPLLLLFVLGTAIVATRDVQSLEHVINAPSETRAWLDTVGFPIATLALLGLAVWKTVPWLKDLGENLAKAHIAFLTNTAEAQTKMMELQREQLEILKDQKELVASIHKMSEGLESGDQRRHWDSRFDTIVERVDEAIDRIKDIERPDKR